MVAEMSQMRTSTAATAGTRTQSAPTVSVVDDGSCGPGNKLCVSSRYGGRGSWVTAIGHLLSCPRNRRLKGRFHSPQEPRGSTIS